MTVRGSEDAIKYIVSLTPCWEGRGFNPFKAGGKRGPEP